MKYLILLSLFFNCTAQAKTKRPFKAPQLVVIVDDYDLRVGCKAYLLRSVGKYSVISVKKCNGYPAIVKKVLNFNILIIK